MKLLQKLVEDYRALFWYIPEEKRSLLSTEAIVETILNYGDIEAVKRLFSIIGKRRAAIIFYRQTNGDYFKRNNYLELVENFFDLYFKKHVPGYPFTKAD